MASNLKVDIVRPTATNGSLSLKGDSGGSATTNGVTVDSSGNTSITGTTTVTVNSTSDALRITQTGTGNALVVEDSANPDSTPFVVDNAGNVGIGTDSPTAKLYVTGSIEIAGNLVESETDLVLNANAVIGGQSSINYIVESDGLHQWWTGATSNKTGRAGATERMRIDSSGNVELKTENAKLILPSGGGISFENHSVSSATGASSTASANVLDDYEKGTWTPQFVDSSGNNDCAAANAFNGAYYTKIGNLVTCSFRWNTSGGTAVDAYLRGIPFSPSSTSGKSLNVVILASDSEGITYWRNDGSDAFTLVGKQLNGLSSVFRAQFSYFTD